MGPAVVALKRIMPILLLRLRRVELTDTLKFLAIILIILMYWVIDPKLRTISEEYEKKQKDYLQHLDEIQKWETTR